MGRHLFLTGCLFVYYYFILSYFVFWLWLPKPFDWNRWDGWNIYIWAGVKVWMDGRITGRYGRKGKERKDVSDRSSERSYSLNWVSIISRETRLCHI